MSLRKPKIYLDMDGVIANFVSGAFSLFNKQYKEREYQRGTWAMWDELGVTEEEFYHRLSQQGVPFWEHLPVFPWAHDLVYRLCEVSTPIICTHPTKDPECYAGKRRWLMKHIHFHNLEVITMKDKYELARAGTMLIDDNGGNCRKFTQRGGVSIIFPQPWNNYADLPDPDRVNRVEYILDEVQRHWKG